MSNKKSLTTIEDEKLIYNALVNDSKSVFYATNKITKNLMKKSKSHCIKNIYNKLENKDLEPERMPLNTKFVEKKNKYIYIYIIRTTLYSFSRPFEALQADIAYISFLAKLAVDPKFCLLFVDLFTSKTYTYPMKKRTLLAKNETILSRHRQKRVR